MPGSDAAMEPITEAAPTSISIPPPAAQNSSSPRTRKAKKPRPTGPVVGKKDEFIMDTNNSSIVSKRSVEKLYYTGPEYFRAFVRKFQRRSPLINRGYWLRMKAIEKTVSRFLAEDDSKTKLVVNLGCGYDPLPFQFLGEHKAECGKAVFVDIDYPQLMQRKLEMIKASELLMGLLECFQSTGQAEMLGGADKYKMLGVNLNDVANLDRVMRANFDLDSDNVAVLFVAEVSVAYMDIPSADAVLKWVAGLRDARFCSLEQHLPDGPDHPFAETMLAHFRKLRTPLHAIGTIDQMRERFVSTGWKAEQVDIRSLWQLWEDDAFFPSDERRSLDKIEPFDEWEEFALYGQHYFLLVARTLATTDANGVHGQEHHAAEPASQKWLSRKIAGSGTKRRFGAVIDHVPHGQELLVQHAGGLGSQERQKSIDIYSSGSKSHDSKLADLPTPLMCHSLTRLGSSGNEILLAGGRTSPDKASAACWIFDGHSWTPTSSMASARYRHCAVAVSLSTANEALTGVLVYGGKSKGDVSLDDCWLFTKMDGWQEVKVDSPSKSEPRFGSAMAADVSGSKGMIVGGMRADGTIINETLAWQLSRNDHGELKISFTPYEAPRSITPALARFGAQLLCTQQGMLLIGGVSSGKMLDRHTEIVNLSTGVFVSIEHEVGPLLVGFAVVALGDGAIGIFGGGATCFSFGTRWSDSCVLTLEGSSEANRLSETIKLVEDTPQQLAATTVLPSRSAKVGGQARSAATVSVPHVSLTDAASFSALLASGRPAIIKSLDIGSCTTKWTPEYLSSSIGADRAVVVHDSTSPSMSFTIKNFSYNTIPFGTFLSRVSAGAPLYLRALSSASPTTQPTDLATDFPSIAPDFVLPPSLDYVQRNAHSSPLRISGPVSMWLHYDVMANVLCQIRGAKTLRIFHPRHVVDLGVAAGASSSALDVFDPATEARLRDAGVEMHEAQLEEGDVLFLPPLWLHAARPTQGWSVAVNVFFRDEGWAPAYAAGKDVYGNRDVAPYERGRRDVQRVVNGFDGLPKDAKGFYLRRLAAELLAAAEE